MSELRGLRSTTISSILLEPLKVDGVTYSIHLGLSPITRFASGIETEIRFSQFDGGRSLDECPSLISGVVAIAYPIHQLLDLHSQIKV